MSGCVSERMNVRVSDRVSKVSEYKCVCVCACVGACVCESM